MMITITAISIKLPIREAEEVKEIPMIAIGVVRNNNVIMISITTTKTL